MESFIEAKAQGSHRLISVVELSENQRNLIRKANAQSLTKINQPNIPVEYIEPKAARFVNGGAPGLIQQR